MEKVECQVCKKIVDKKDVIEPKIQFGKKKVYYCKNCIEANLS